MAAPAHRHRAKSQQVAKRPLALKTKGSASKPKAVQKSNGKVKPGKESKGKVVGSKKDAKAKKAKEDLKKKQQKAAEKKALKVKQLKQKEKEKKDKEKQKAAKGNGTEAGLTRKKTSLDLSLTSKNPTKKEAKCDDDLRNIAAKKLLEEQREKAGCKRMVVKENGKSVVKWVPLKKSKINHVFETPKPARKTQCEKSTSEAEASELQRMKAHLKESGNSSASEEEAEEVPEDIFGESGESEAEEASSNQEASKEEDESEDQDKPEEEEAAQEEDEDELSEEDGTEDEVATDPESEDAAASEDEAEDEPAAPAAEETEKGGGEVKAGEANENALVAATNAARGDATTKYNSS